MAKKKKDLVINQRILHYSLAFALSILCGAGVTVVLVLKVVPEKYGGYLFYLILIFGCAALGSCSVIFFPKRLVLRKKALVMYGFGGRIKGQLPYDNIRDIRLQHHGDENKTLESAGIDLIRESRDTWWHRGFISIRTRNYDIELNDTWDKPPSVIIRLVKAKMEEFFLAAGRGE